MIVVVASPDVPGLWLTASVAVTELVSICPWVGDTTAVAVNVISWNPASASTTGVVLIPDGVTKLVV